MGLRDVTFNGIEGMAYHHGSPDHEEKPWHNVIGHGDVRPRRVVQVRVGLADLVSKNHQCDGQASLDVKGQMSAML